ncbi:alpha-amylase family glycosyl hydrolase [Granulicella sp. L60]|uniref:alpha-amylase family glycosyl hydrolase n=1 Tax=Granulicella sp. L60 TaxID=1641866 RepID=UPI00131E852B|nr:alpha-amylase family glycosyl hydrolase [Granulicella sp. L60]
MHNLAWWQSAVIYEVYPRSFQDSNGDGIGDLDGIIQRLDYLVGIGVGAIWIAPIYRSPMADFGYDVADYCDVDPIFGNLQDFDRLLIEAHRRDLKVILDFVPNHSSDRHPWFLESRSSRENAKRDWYLWRDQSNNWMSNFGGSGWEWDELTSQYYYHSFLKEQPDLNWRNPAVRAAMYDALRFWLDKGVDGFRVDVMWLIIKDDQYRDNPSNPDFGPDQSSGNSLLPVYNSNRPEVHEVVAEMRAVIDSYPGRVLIGEIYLPVKDLMTYYGQDLNGANLPFNFLLLQCPWNARAIAQVISEYMTMLPPGAWPNWVLGNHDNARIATRVGLSQTAIAAMLLLTLPGTLTIYYGEEIGMTNAFVRPEDVQDPAEKRQPGIGMGRDPERSPMTWDCSDTAGFTRGQPWLPLGADHRAVNVEVENCDEESMLNLYRRLIALRRAHPALVSGQLRSVTSLGDLLNYELATDHVRLMVFLNFGHSPVQVAAESGIVLAGTDSRRRAERVGNFVELKGSEGIVIKIPS